MNNIHPNAIAGGIGAVVFLAAFLSIHFVQPKGFRTEETKDMNRESVKINYGMTVLVSAIMGGVAAGAFLLYKKSETPRMQFGGAFYSF